MFTPHKKRGQGVVHVSDLFKKYLQVLHAPQGVVIQAFINASREVCGAVVRKEQCSFTVSTKTLVFKGSGMVKTEILLHKKDILDSMRYTIGEQSIPKEIL